ncbi:MAG TPA: GAF domain-containing protein [Anaerolineae bacterium]|nr:GAF domain-containing protein [Anaerolineae bacterium]HQH37058.1 GAF domain-containing protein [Anaerolineae bacterium]
MTKKRKEKLAEEFIDARTGDTLDQQTGEPAPWFELTQAAMAEILARLFDTVTWMPLSEATVHGIIAREPLTVHTYTTTLVGDERQTQGTYATPLEDINGWPDQPHQVIFYDNPEDHSVAMPESLRARMVQRGYRSALTTGLMAHGELVGFLTLSSTASLPDGAQSEIQDAVGVLADSIGVALDSLLQGEQTRRRTEQLETLSVIESALLETSTEAEILDVFILALKNTATLTAWLVYTDADAGGTLTSQIVASWHEGGIQPQDSLLHHPLFPDTFPMSRLWLGDLDQTFYTFDLRQDVQMDVRAREWAVKYGFVSVVVLPLRHDGHLQGVIVLNWTEPYTLSDTERFLLRRLLRPTVALLSRRRAYLAEEAARAENERRATQFQTAAEVAHAASSIIDLDTLLPQAVELLRERFDLYYVGVFLVDETKQWVALRAGTGEAGRTMLERRHGFAVGGNSMIGRCVAEATPQIPESVEAAVRYVNPLLPDTTAEIALPLVSRNQMIGAMSIQSSKVRAFSVTDITILQTVADQLANAIQNARLFDQLNTSLVESEMQTEVSLAINEAQSVSEIARAAARVAEFMGLEGVLLHDFTRWDEAGRPVSQDIYSLVMHETAAESNVVENIEVDQELLDWILADIRRIYVSRDLVADQELPESVRANLLAQGYNSMIGAVVSTRSRLLGFLIMHSTQPVEEFPTRYIQVFVRTLTDQVSTGLERYTLLRESARRAARMEAASEIARYAASILDQETLLTEVAKLIRERFHIDYVGIYMVDDSGQWAVLHAASGGGEGSNAALPGVAQGQRLAVGGDTMVGMCVSTATPRVALAIDEKSPPFDVATAPGTRSAIVLPLISQNVVIGAIAMNSLEAAAYSQEDMAILQTMVDHLTTTIGNARLFAQSQASLEELQRVQQRYAVETWDSYVEKQDIVGYAYDLNAMTPLPVEQADVPADFWGGQLFMRSGEDGGDGATLAAPFAVRNEPVGFMSFEEPGKSRTWTDDNVAVIEAVREQLSLALENRLLIDQSQNALREARQREREVRFLQEVAAFLNATESIVASQGELRDHLQAFIPLDSLSIVGYDANRRLYFVGEQTANVLDPQAWSGVEVGEGTGYAWVVEMNEPLVSDDIRQTPRFREDETLIAAGITSRAVMPLRLGVRTLGTLNLESRQPGVFSRPELMPILLQVTAQVASAMERANLLQRAQESAGESRTLYEATSALAEATSYEAVLRAIVGHTILSEKAWAEIALFVVDPETGAAHNLLEIVGSWSSVPSAGELEVGQRMGLAEFPALQLIPPEQQLYICEDIDRATDMPPAIRSFYLEQGVQALVIARLSTGGGAPGGELGLFQLRFVEPYHPSEQDVRLYDNIADQAAVVLSNQQLLRLSEARTEQLTAAVDFANLATALSEREDLLKKSVDFFKTRFGFYYVSISMLDEEGEWAVLQAGTGDVAEKLLRMGTRVRVDTSSMIGWCILNDQPRIAQDVTRDPLYFENPLLPNVRSSIALPLKSRGQVNGALTIDSDRRFAFTGEIISTLELMATQLANMIESADLYDRSQSSLAETRMLYRIAQQITDALTVENVFKAAVEGISQRPEPDLIVAAQLEPRQTPTSMRIVGSWSRDGVPLPFEAYSFEQIPRLAAILRDDESFVTPDVTQDPQVDEFFRAMFGQLGLRAMAAFQLRIYGVQYGTVMIHSRKAREFSNTELRFYENVSRQAFVALQNINLVEETREQAERRDILNEVLRTASSSLDRLSLLRDVGRVIATRLERPVLMWNWDNQMLTVVSGHEAGGKLMTNGDSPPSLTRTDAPLLYQVVDRMIPVSIDFMQEHGPVLERSFAHFDQPLVEGYAVPLRVRGTVFGIMLLGRHEDHPPFDEETKDFMRTAGVNVSVALQTAILYQDAQETAVKLQEVDKLKNQFMANMSHELRTPLNSIIGFSRVILKGIDGPLTDMQKTDLTAIYESGRNLLELINDILDISKIDAGKMEMAFEPTNLQEIVRSVVTTIAGQLMDSPVEVLTDVPEELPVVLADSRRIRQVLTNLVGNAVKFTDHGYIKISASYDNYRVIMSVEDTGIGIPPDRRQAVFEKFEQVDSSSTRRYGGTGLGLPLSREFVRLHGGDMDFESVPGEGSRFFFWIPIGGPSAKREGEDKETQQAGVRTILTIDDDEGVITLFQRYLEKQGYNVAGMTTGEGVVETAKRLKPYAITLDVIMPGKDGWQIIQELRADPETRDIPIIVCSILSEADKGMSMGVADYLVKPITEQDLLDALRHLEQPGAVGHVLVVDDNPDDRKLLRRILEDGGYKVEEATGGAEAIDVIHTDPPNLLILDLMMPDVDGFAVLENLKMSPLTRDIPVIVVTAKELSKAERERLQQRVEALLQKGLFDQNQLLNDVLSALERLKGT